jgi:glycogen debranching enzyme
MTETQAAAVANAPTSGAHAALVRAGLELLDANSIGTATRPGPLYPHQWSWDSAAIAMGRSPWDQEGAERELRSLFAAQWSDGLLPHIVFTDSDAYFPGPGFWQTERAAHAPADARTSGIVQPPIHATAAWRVYLKAADRERATIFLRDLFPGLVAWHDYLYRFRQRDGDGLVEVWHPWESGMDNSPAWDEALARIRLTPADVPEYRRVDVDLSTDPAGRPSDAEYDRYAYLVQVFREHDYDSERLRETTPFAIQPLLFNSLLVQSGRDLARIARVVGADGAPYEAQADATAAGLEKLWDESAQTYLDWDALSGRPVRRRTAAGFAPLYAGVPSPRRAQQMLDAFARFQAPLGDGLVAVPTIAPDEPDFAPGLYWRGPVWPIFQWVVHHGARRYGREELARALRETTLALTERSGFWEHYSPLTGDGQGDPGFSWTVGLVLDLVEQVEIGVEGEQTSSRVGRDPGPERR